MSWAGASRVFRIGFQFIVTMILARLLSPADFGIIGMSYVFIGLALIFQELGLGAALIYRKDLTEEHINSVFYVNIVAGVAIAGLMILCTPLIAKFYHQEILNQVLPVLACNFLIAPLSVVQRNLLMKNMQFHKLAQVEIIAALFGGGTGIIAAYGGLGVWSLVLQFLATSSTTTLFLWVFSSWRPRLMFSKDRLFELLGFSMNFTGSMFFFHIAANIPHLIIGRYLGSTAVGYFTIASYLTNIPKIHVTAVLSQVVFPAFSIIQDDLDKIRINYIKMIKYLAFFTFPIFIGSIVLAAEAIPIIYGDQWLAAIFLFQVMAFIGLDGSVMSLSGTIFKSQGRLDLDLYWSIIRIPIMVAAIFLGLPYNLEGVVITLTLATVISSWIPQIWANRLIKLSTIKFIKTLAPVLGLANLMGLITYVLRYTLIQYWNPPTLVIFSIATLFGATVYLVLARLTRMDIAKEIWQQGREILANRRQKKQYAQTQPPNTAGLELKSEHIDETNGQ